MSRMTPSKLYSRGVSRGGWSASRGGNLYSRQSLYSRYGPRPSRGGPSRGRSQGSRGSRPQQSPFCTAMSGTPGMASSAPPQNSSTFPGNVGPLPKHDFLKIKQLLAAGVAGAAGAANNGSAMQQSGSVSVGAAAPPSLISHQDNIKQCHDLHGNETRTAPFIHRERNSWTGE